MILLIGGAVAVCLVICGLGIWSLVKALQERKKAAEIYRDGPGSTGIVQMALSALAIIMGVLFLIGAIIAVIIQREGSAS
jgi:uncharacterized BrkB/YihY/UPF0761 family membrane protein